MTDERLSKFIEAVRRAYPTDSLRPEDWHPDDQKLYFEGEFYSDDDRHNAIFENRLRRIAEAAMAVATDPNTPPEHDCNPILVTGLLLPNYIVCCEDYQSSQCGPLEIGQIVHVTDGSGTIAKAQVTGKASFSGTHYFRVTHEPTHTHKAS
jgi:hypothetical protein